ncbi:MAG: anaerobic sulfatase maturase [Bacteroidota bacterium]
MRKLLNSVLIKPSGPDCNLDCTYCFYLDKAGLFPGTPTHRMSLDTLEQLVRQAMQYSPPQISFGWQGGEPTLMGLPFFRKAVEFQERYGAGKTVGNGLQTNGVLLDSDWAKFLADYNVLVGLSLDGPRHIHDRYRVAKGGQGSWQTVCDSAKILLDAGVATNALIVVNDYSVRFPEEIYQFHKSLGLSYMQFIPCVETDPRDSSRAAPYSVSAEQYGEFLVKLFDLWHADIHDGVATTSLRSFDSVFHRYVGLEAPDCTLMKTCGAYLVVEHSGDVYACDFFVEDDWKLGNIMTHRLDEMLNSPRQTEFGKLKAALPGECVTCEWLRKCQGGCTKDRIRDPRDQGSNHFCRSYMKFFEHADVALTTLADRWRSEQASAIGMRSGRHGA